LSINPKVLIGIDWGIHFLFDIFNGFGSCRCIYIGSLYMESTTYKDNGMPVEEDAYLKGESNEKRF